MVLTSDDSDASDSSEIVGCSGKGHSRGKMVVILVVQMVPLLQVQIPLEATPGLKGQGNLILRK
jgi:hypothetical protein